MLRVSSDREGVGDVAGESPRRGENHVEGDVVAGEVRVACKPVLRGPDDAPTRPPESDRPSSPEEIPQTGKGRTRPNEPCPCGSGKKYKKCCGQREKRGRKKKRRVKAKHK